MTTRRLLGDMSAAPPATKEPTSLWRNANFRRVWLATVISVAGSQVSIVALPLVAIRASAGSALDLGVIAAASQIATIFSPLGLGVWVDRSRRKSVLLVSDLARFMVFASIPIASAFGAVTVGQLVAVSLVAGLFSVAFELAYYTYVPDLVGRRDLLRANSSLIAGNTAASVVGPGLGGLLCAALTAPVAIVVDAASYVASFLTILRVDVAERPAAPLRRRVSREEVFGGLRFLFATRQLRVVASSLGLINLCGSGVMALVVLFAVQSLRLSAAEIGVAFSIAGIGAFAGSIATRGLARRFGAAVAILVGTSLYVVGTLLVPVAGGGRVTSLLGLALAMAVRGFGATQTDVQVLALRQALTPPEMLGRVNAANKFVIGAGRPIGAISAGVCGSLIGVRVTIAIAALGALVGLVRMVVAVVPHRGEYDHEHV